MNHGIPDHMEMGACMVDTGQTGLTPSSVLVALVLMDGWTVRVSFMAEAVGEDGRTAHASQFYSRKNGLGFPWRARVWTPGGLPYTHHRFSSSRHRPTGLSLIRVKRGVGYSGSPFPKWNEGKDPVSAPHYQSPG